MRGDNGRAPILKPGFDFKLDNARPRGPTFIIRPARDAISIPEEPAVVEIAKKNLCKLGLGENCYTLTNVYGVKAFVPYNASLNEWRRIAEDLLAKAMAYENGDE